MSQCIAGIDPGAKGAIAFIWPERKMLEVFDMPVFKVTGSQRVFTYVDASALARLFQRHKPTTTWVERVHAMPEDGAVGAFTFGQGYGTVLGVLGALGIPVKDIEPATWKAVMGATANKKQSRERARALLPGCAHLFTRPDKAEAAMIALFGCLGTGIAVKGMISPNTLDTSEGVM